MKQTAVAQATGSNKSQEESSRIGKASLSDAYKCYGTFPICNISPKIMKGFDQKISLEKFDRLITSGTLGQRMNFKPKQ